MATPSTTSSTRLSVQFLILSAALLVWTIWRTSQIWVLVCAYVIAWLGFNLFARNRSFVELPWSRRTVFAWAALLLAAPLTILYEYRDDIVFAEGFHAFSYLHSDRSRLETVPSISPPTLHFDHPQTHYIYATGAESVSLDLGPGVQSIDAEDLGHGLFRTRYDPRKHGLPETAMATLEARLIVDGVSHPRPLSAVKFEPHPRWFSSAPERGLAATVSEETDEVFIVSRNGLEHRIQTDDGPSDCAFFGGGSRLAVTHRYSKKLRVLDPETGAEIASSKIGFFQHRIAASPDGKQLALALTGTEPEIRILNADTLEEDASVALPFRPDWIAFGKSNSSLVISCSENGALYRLDRIIDRWEFSDPLLIGSPPVTLARSTDGGRVYVAATDFRPDGSARAGNHFVQDQILTVDVATLRVVGKHLTGRRDAQQDSPGGINRGASPIAIATRPGGALLIAFAGSDEVWETDLFSVPKTFSGPDFGLVVPHGVADLGDGYFAVSSGALGVISIFKSDGKLAHFVSFTEGDAKLAAHPNGSLGSLSLDLRYGEWAFFEATRSGISCQSCHLHTGTDHTFHDIGQEALPMTLTTRGIAGTTPYLRDASYARVRDLNDHVAESLYRGYIREDPARGFDLETYVESLPRSVNPALHDIAADHRAGLDAFVKADCVLCHAFPAFTNLSQHPVATLFPEIAEGKAADAVLDTPSLIGLWDKRRFFHDGRAERLEDVFGKFNKSNRHGNTKILDESERRALADFLLSL